MSGVLSRFTWPSRLIMQRQGEGQNGENEPTFVGSFDRCFGHSARNGVRDKYSDSTRVKRICGFTYKCDRNSQCHDKR